MALRVSVVSAVTAGLFATIVTSAGLAQEADSKVPGGAPVAIPATPAVVTPPRRPLVRAGSPMMGSLECKVKSPAFEGRTSLRAVRRAILANRPVRVVAIGSSSTVGVGASSPRATYPVRLENDLEGVIEGLKVEMYSRGVSGEVAEGAAERLKLEVAEVKPDLVVWQVGTNDAVARIDVEVFGAELRDTLSWLAYHNIDVVLIDPQYIERLAKDPLYTGIVNEIATVASEMHVMLVNRYDAMADLARQNPGSSYLASDRFHLNDLGYRCMAEYATRAIVAGILQSDTENGAMH
jgi:acyl-CoA thioesterase-1